MAAGGPQPQRGRPPEPQKLPAEKAGERGICVTTEYLLNRELGHVLAALTRANALVMRVCLHTGMRLGDVLALKTDDLIQRPPQRGDAERSASAGGRSASAGGRGQRAAAAEPQRKAPSLRLQFWIQEQKTGKRRRVNLTKELAAEMAKYAGKTWVFESPKDPAKHRTRQAVWADVKRAAKAFRLPQNVAPHSVRKVYAVDLLEKYGDIRRVQRALNHSNPSVTMIYAMADKLYTAKYHAREC